MRQLYFFLQLVNLSNEIKRAVRENHDKTVTSSMCHIVSRCLLHRAKNKRPLYAGYF